MLVQRAGGALVKLGSKLPYVGGIISFFGGGEKEARFIKSTIHHFMHRDLNFNKQINHLTSRFETQ
ncbi:18479_t:CDS:2 [Dentiscutata erythropus]|uniref:18479_t:CDS:1 n=1 Tax=Dentiscutata erythropus TaxID=1348616 RepID=A0A9N9FPL0_9GLOM|nr:18479_t:CDS:2 [Dentiscutata erythropus]